MDESGTSVAQALPFVTVERTMQSIIFRLKMLHKGGEKQREKIQENAYARVSTNDQNLDLRMDALNRRDE